MAAAEGEAAFEEERTFIAEKVKLTKISLARRGERSFFAQRETIGHINSPKGGLNYWGTLEKGNVLRPSAARELRALLNPQSGAAEKKKPQGEKKKRVKGSSFLLNQG